MQDSKINSTLKIGIKMTYLEGTKDFYAPALRSAPVFGGIAGIISSSDPAATGTPQQLHHHHEASAAAAAAAARGEGEDAEANNNFASLPAMNSTSGKEIGELQDMYRKTLSAFWSSQPGELKADECIEDIFAGGDGWGKGGRPNAVSHNTVAVNANVERGSRPGSGASTPNPHHSSEDHSHSHGGSSGRGETGRGGGNASSSASSVGNLLHRHDYSRHGHGHHHHAKQRQKMHGGADELDEMDVREDLRGWRIGEAAYS